MVHGRNDWTIQIVHYPLSAFVNRETYKDFQAKHIGLLGSRWWFLVSRGLSALILWSADGRPSEISGRWCSP